MRSWRFSSEERVARRGANPCSLTPAGQRAGMRGVAATDLRTIGQSVPKPDAWLKATGSATYAGDVRLPGMLEARVLRSPHAHARIVSVDATAAEALPGVFAVATGRDVPARRIGNGIHDRHALARDKVIYVG